MLNSFLSFQTEVNFVTFECFLKKFLDTVALSTHEFKWELLGGGERKESNVTLHPIQGE